MGMYSLHLQSNDCIYCGDLVKISNKFIKYSYLLIAFGIAGCDRGCETFEFFSKVSASFDTAAPKIEVASTKDKPGPAPTPVVFTSPKAAVVAPSNYTLNPANCNPFTQLVTDGFDVVFVDKKSGVSKNSGESWDKAVPSVKEAINLITAPRSARLSSGKEIKPAFIAIAGGKYLYDNENKVGGAVGARSEIISLYGEDKKVYSRMYIYGGFKKGDTCSSVEKNNGYLATDKARKTVLNGQNNASVVAIGATAAQDIHFSHLTFKNGDARDPTGAISPEKNDGGGISLRADNLNNITFNKITISGDTKAKNNGGCVSVIGKDIKNINFTKSDFSGCKAETGHGGGIYVKVEMTAADPDANIKINNTTVSTNEANAGNGGGIYLEGDAYAGFDGIKVTANKAKFGGGIASKDKAHFVIDNKNNEIINNSITQDAGAGIYINNNNTDKKDYILKGLKIADNKSSHAGRITGLGVYINNAGNVSFDTTEVSDHTATKETFGVGIYLKNNTKVSFSALTCNKNSSDVATSKGGCLYSGDLLDVFVPIDPTKPFGNTNYSNLVFDEAKAPIITNNKAGYGGGLYIENTRLDQLVSFTCNSNNAVMYGACLYLGKNIATGKLNNAKPPVMVVNEANPLDIKSLTCSNNKAMQGGGCLASNNNVKNYQFHKTLLSNNEAKNGGAMYFSVAPRLTIKNTKFASNKATDNGGAIYFANGWTAFNNELDDSVAGEDIGVPIKLTGETKVHNQFLSNHAGNDGGAIYVAAGNVNFNSFYIKHSTVHRYLEFEKNSAFNNGGAICFAKTVNNSIDITGRYIENQAKFGGAIALLGKNNDVSISKIVKKTGKRNKDSAIFIKNQAVSGSALGINSLVSGLMISGTYHENAATQEGGSVYIFDVKNRGLTFDGEYIGNKATNGSGIVDFFEASNAHLIFMGSYKNNNPGVKNHSEISTIVQNIDRLTLIGEFSASAGEKTIDGGGFNLQDVLRLDINHIVENYKTSANGGFIKANNIKNFNLANKLDKNEAKNGGAIYIADYLMNLNINFFVNIAENKASENGGVIYVGGKLGSLKMQYKYFLSGIFQEVLKRVNNSSDSSSPIDFSNSYEDEENKLKQQVKDDKTTILGIYAKKISTELKASDDLISDFLTDRMNVANFLLNVGITDMAEKNTLTVKLNIIKDAYKNDLLFIDAEEQIRKRQLLSKKPYFIDDKKMPFSKSTNGAWKANTAQNGGILYVEGATGQVSIKNQVLYKNEAANDGGAFYFNNNVYDLDVKECLFYGNAATNNGGVFYVKNRVLGNVRFDGTRNFDINPEVLYSSQPYFAIAAYDAADAYSIGTALGQIPLDKIAYPVGKKLYDRDFFNNKSSDYANARGMFLFQNNQATNLGGIGYFGEVKGDFTMTNMPLANNKAANGGAFYINNLNGNVNYNPAINILLNTKNADSDKAGSDKAGIVVGNKAGVAARKN
jgi:predicted outer membrane repeat protein